MTLGMFALVVFILVLVSVFSAMFSGQIGQFTADASGGFNVVVQSNPSNPVAFGALARDPDVRAVAPLVTTNVEVVAAPGLTTTAGVGARPASTPRSSTTARRSSTTRAATRPTRPPTARCSRRTISRSSTKSFLASGGGPPDSSIGHR